MGSILATGASGPGFDSHYSLKKIADENIVEAAEVNQWCWFKESGQWHKNVD